ncbi:hypothetical protein Tco_0007778 [Tanacetum coccineum]
MYIYIDENLRVVIDDEDIFQSDDSQTTVKPSFKKIEFTKARNEPVKSDKQAVKPRMVTQSPKVDRKYWNGKMTQKLGLENVSTQQYIVFPLWSSISSSYKSSDNKAEDDTVDDDACKKNVQKPASEYDQALKNVYDKMMDQEK